MTEETLITDEALAMIGAETEPFTGYPVAEHEIRRFAYAVGDQNELWVEPERAVASANGGIVAPPFFHRIPFPYDFPLVHLRTDGVPRVDGTKPRPPLRSTRSMAGGVEVEFGEPIRPGDVLTKQCRLAELYERQGRSGRLAFCVYETTYRNQRGEMVAVEKQTTIVR